MRYFRALANLGATVLVLHHSGKSDSAKLYRGSSDIKAAVDTAYVLEKPADESDRLGKLTLNCFKGRLTPGQNFGMKFTPGEGFVALDAFRRAKTTDEVVAEILSKHPNSNQQKVIEMGRAQGCGKRQLENCLKTGRWQIKSGPNNSRLYSLPPIDGAKPTGILLPSTRGNF